MKVTLQVKKIKKFAKKASKLILPALLLVIISLPIVIYATYSFVFFQKIFPFISLAGLELGGQRKGEAVANLQKLYDINGKIEIFYVTKSWQIPLKKIKFAPDFKRSVDFAYLIGRREDLLTQLGEKWQAWFKGEKLPLFYQIDDQLLRTEIASISAEINTPSFPASIEAAEGKIIIDKGKTGRKVNEAKLYLTIKEKLALQTSLDIILPVITSSSQITEEQAQKTKEKAERLLGKKIILLSKDKSWQLEDKELIKFLSFENGSDNQKIASYTASLASTIDRPAQNALFSFENGRVTQFKAAEDGIKLDQEKTTSLIADGLKGLEKEENEIVKIALPFVISPPEITTSQVNTLGIKELLGKGESWFCGSISSRIHNISLASSKLNGLLVPPGEIFAFNSSLGEVSEKTGFQQAYIIKEGRTVLGDGGGVCQVSTTLFRATLAAGLPIIERKAHAYRVAYYEQNYQVGIDATVYDPSADLKFKNDTPAHILIQATTNVTACKLTFGLYGSSDGRQVFISKSRVWDQAPPPPDLYQDDPNLPKGVIKQVDWSAWGANVAFDWKVTKDNEVLQEKTFYSAYRPWQAIFLRGTKE